MNAVLVPPQTKFAAALLAAGVVSAASIVALPENRSLPTINTNVANASVITDWLGNFGDAVSGVAAGVALPVYAGLELPFDATAAIAAAVQNPSLSPNLLSWLVQRYVNPSNAYRNDNYSYLWNFKVSAIEPLANLLPYPLGLNIINSVNQIANAINGAFSGLPSSDPGATATYGFWGSDIGQTVQAASLAVTAPVWVLSDATNYLGYLPANVEASVESAIQDPSKIPGLVSSLVYGLLSPSYGLLGNELYDVTSPFTSLPGPIGELANNIVTAISNDINGVLSMLPKQISPNPSAIQASVPSATTSVAPNSLPAASLAVAGGITLKSTDPVEKTVGATDSPAPSAEDSSSSSAPATAPSDPAPASAAVAPVAAPATPAAGDVKPVATPVADTGTPKTGADSSATTNPVTSGNKVTPGDTFGSGAKGGTVKGNGGGVSGSGVSGAVTSVASGAGGAGAVGVSGGTTSVASGAGGAGAAGASTAGKSGEGVSHAAA